MLFSEKLVLSFGLMHPHVSTNIGLQEERALQKKKIQKTVISEWQHWC
jgi:hypothetical protein